MNAISRSTKPAKRARAETAPFVINLVLPIKGHPVLVDDAINSIAKEIDAGTINRLIVVNDGCSYLETLQSLGAWQLILGDKIRVGHYINGGLSAARNRGIEHALACDPDLDAIFLLDADNMLAPDAGATMQAMLASHPRADWFYPDFDFFGQQGHYITERDYNLLFHAQVNLCEAGSLVRRRILDAGVRFDEGMRQGYEDWDFWLSAAQKGFRGHSVAQPLQLYRKRPVSMLSESHDADAALRQHIVNKHQWLFNVPKMLALESQLFPRFAVIEGSTGIAYLQTDPMQAQEITLDELERMIMAHLANPYANHAPPYVVFLRDGVSARLRAASMLHSFFWNTERRRARGEAGTDFDLFYLESSDAGHRIVTNAHNDDRLADGVALDLITLRRLLDESETGDLLRLDHLPSPFNAAGWSVDLEKMVPLNLVAESAQELMRRFMLRLSRSRYLPAVDMQWEWRQVGGAVDKSRSVHIPRRAADGGVVFPLLKQAGTQDVGFVLPIFDFGGVEKVVASIAREFAENGYRCHLFVISDRPIHPDDWTLKSFSTINWMADSSAIDWTGQEFVGTAEPSWGNWHEKADLIGLLSSMDVVINAHSGALHKVANLLRRKGVIMIDHEHLMERSTYGRAYGPPHLAMAYEFAYDLILTCSDSLRVWMHGQGVPEEKLLTVSNAPGYPLAPEASARVMNGRQTATADRPLNVLFLGRLDPQKGVHRLADIFHMLAQQVPDIQISIAGSSVIDASSSGFAFPAQTKMLGAVRGRDALTDLFAQADIMILPSLYEGLPLSILEAQRCGVVVLATDVGAVSEAITDGVNGLLINEIGCEVGFVEQIIKLDKNRDQLTQISQQAADMHRDWAAAILPLLKWLSPRTRAQAHESHQHLGNPVRSI
ncbi:glycosyltransferase [Ketogulonicigenium vulgare]|uniref:glycosyltransferase n=1 Tax=Ketogulonicigenium vulgare TaxID=92945 RepID=UPI002358BBF6|nr:glycosyltransferase [Ketogulonicigenium vulgare]